MNFILLVLVLMPRIFKADFRGDEVIGFSIFFSVVLKVVQPPKLGSTMGNYFDEEKKPIVPLTYMNDKPVLANFCNLYLLLFFYHKILKNIL